MNTSRILTRRTLIGLAVFTLIDFAASGLLGNPKHGVRGAFADITWFAFLVCALVLLVACGFVLVRSSARSRRRRTVG